MVKVFIDGKEGTTGLKIYERFTKRADIELLTIPEVYRKDINARKDYINGSDITFLCLPDAAAREAVSLAEGNVRLIDASTAHRTAAGWDYGFPELSADFRERIKTSNRVAVPGCHASGFISIVYPLVKLGIISEDYPVVCHSITGYSGGGKSMIADYEADNRSRHLDSPRQYGLEQKHKHLAEMHYYSNLKNAPIFMPVVADYYRGMEVTVPLFSYLVGGRTPQDIAQALKDYYAGQSMVAVTDYMGESEGLNRFLPGGYMQDRCDMMIFTGGNDERIIVSSLFDNLGKGASGAAIQCMNIMLGLDETTGLL